MAIRGRSDPPAAVRTMTARRLIREPPAGGATSERPFLAVSTPPLRFTLDAFQHAHWILLNQIGNLLVH